MDVFLLFFLCIDLASCPNNLTFVELPGGVEEAGGKLAAGG